MVTAGRAALAAGQFEVSRKDRMGRRLGSRFTGAVVLAMAAAAMLAGPRAALRASNALRGGGAIALEPLPDVLPDSPVLVAPRVLSGALEALRSGATPWLLAAQTLRAELERGSAQPRAELTGLLGDLPWDAARAGTASVLPDLTPGLHPLQIGGMRGTLAVTQLPDGRRTLALGARGGAWNLVVSARGRLAPGAEAAPAALELGCDLAWTRPGSGPERSRTWTAFVSTASGDPLRAPAGGRAAGTLRVQVTAPDGRTGELALQLGLGGLRVRGRWPAASGVTEELSTSDERITVEAHAPGGAAEHRVTLPADGGPIRWRALASGPSGRTAGLVDGHLDSAAGMLGTWQDLAAAPPAAGVFHVDAGALLVVFDHLGRSVSTALSGQSETAGVSAGRL